jgi:hypothetical protein
MPLCPAIKIFEEGVRRKESGVRFKEEGVRFEDAEYIFFS